MSAPPIDVDAMPGDPHVPRDPLRLVTLSKRARSVIAASGVTDITQPDATARLDAVRGCGWATILEIAQVAEVAGMKLGGFTGKIGWNSKPTITATAAARALGIDKPTFMILAAIAYSYGRPRGNCVMWSEMDLAWIRRVRSEIEQRDDGAISATDPLGTLPPRQVVVREQHSAAEAAAEIRKLGEPFAKALGEELRT